MKYDPEKYHRRSIRIRGYNYSQGGMYVVTICTLDRESLFGEVVDGDMRLSNVGRMAQAAWDELPVRFPGVRLDVFVVMPNHIHGIIIVGAQLIAPSYVRRNSSDGTQQGAMNRAPTLGEIVRTFKAVSTRVIRRTVKPDFAWQRNYYEHVIREDESLNRIRQYFLDNPARWAYDRENPAATQPEMENAWLRGGTVDRAERL
jgi:REP element-mobilizing transposase RayT